MSTQVIQKVVIFGATGNTGLATVSEAIKKGYNVTAFVRDPKKLPDDVKPALVIQGDVLNKDDVDKAVKGQDGVIVVLGTRNDLSPTTVMSEGTNNIVNAMKNNGIQRISCCVSSFLFWERTKVPSQFLALTEDHERMVKVLKDSDRQWVAVFPPHISEEPARGDYKMVNDAAVNRVISKYDLAEILVKCLTSDEHVGHTVGIGYPSA